MTIEEIADDILSFIYDRWVEEPKKFCMHVSLNALGYSSDETLNSLELLVEKGDIEFANQHRMDIPIRILPKGRSRIINERKQSLASPVSVNIGGQGAVAIGDNASAQQIIEQTVSDINEKLLEFLSELSQKDHSPIPLEIAELYKAVTAKDNPNIKRAFEVIVEKRPEWKPEIIRYMRHVSSSIAGSIVFEWAKSFFMDP